MCNMLHAFYVVCAICAMQDFHRKLEIEKVERRQSDSQALQLLEEVREQGKIAQQLREGEARSVSHCIMVPTNSVLHTSKPRSLTLFHYLFYLVLL